MSVHSQKRSCILDSKTVQISREKAETNRELRQQEMKLM